MRLLSFHALRPDSSRLCRGHIVNVLPSDFLLVGYSIFFENNVADLLLSWSSDALDFTE